jgi:hypothetical protein
MRDDRNPGGSAPRGPSVSVAIISPQRYNRPARCIPDNVKAQAWLYVGRTYDLAGRRDEAKKAYTRVVDDFEKQARPADYARMGLLAPYRRPERWGPPAKAGA